MKPNIHPDYHEITVKLPNGESFQTRSTYGKAGATLQLDIDPSSHPAWTGGATQLKRDGRVAKFNQRFGGLNFGSAKKEEEKKEENK